MMFGLIILATAASSSIFRSRIPFLIAVLHAEDRRHLQPRRIHHRHMGENFEQLSSGADACVIPPLIFLAGHLLFGLSAAAVSGRTVSHFNPVLLSRHRLPLSSFSR